MKYLFIALFCVSCSQVPVQTTVQGNYVFSKSGNELYAINEKDAIQYFYWITRENDILQEQLESTKLDLIDCKALTSDVLDVSQFNYSRPIFSSELKYKTDNRFTIHETALLNDFIKEEQNYQNKTLAGLKTLKTDLRSCHRTEANNARALWNIEKKQTNLISKQMKKYGRSIAQEESQSYEEPQVPYEPDQQPEEPIEPQERTDQPDNYPIEQQEYTDPINDY